MRYISTRGHSGAEPSSFCDILLEGLAPDGGLYVPESYPQVDQEFLAELRKTLADDGYAAAATKVLELFIDDIPSQDLARLCSNAYTVEHFGDPRIVPVDQVGDTPLWIGHLSNGPTAAFKDMAMQLLGELFEYELERRGDWLTVLGATSGDTGSAAEYALRGRSGISVFMLTPGGRMTPFQQAQMFSLDDPNIINIAVDGVFDDCQDLVKAVNMDADFKARWHLGAVNSINWARLVAQVAYYFVCWLEVTETDDQQVSFAVPSGNFGNICAGHVARQMGLPIESLVLATNENDVLDEFLRTGVYRVRSAAETLATSSPSMDISKASNFERFIFDLLGRDGERVADLFGRQLAQTGQFDLSGTPEFKGLRDRYGFMSGKSTHADRVATIRRLWQRHAVMIDPHTADAFMVGQDHVGRVAAPIIVLETALPVKFAETIREATGTAVVVPARFQGIEDAPRRVIELANDVEALKALIEQTLV